MSIVSMQDFAKKRLQKADDEEKVAERFVMESWGIAVDNSRNLPWEVAVKLIQQIMLDHGIRKEDIE